MTNRWLAMVGLGVGAATALGCSGGEPVDLGEGVTGEELSHYVGSWDGYAEAFTFEGGSDRLRLTLAEDGSGQLEAGDKPALAPPEDPESGYPVGWTLTEYVQRSPLIAGFGYPLHDTRVEQRRIRFVVDQLEVFAAWCGIQTPVLLDESNPDYGYGCVAGVGFGAMGKSDCYLIDSETSEHESIDCVRLELCHSVCTACTATECSPQDEHDASFDAVLENDGEELVGTLVVNDQRVTVRLQRSPP